MRVSQAQQLFERHHDDVYRHIRTRVRSTALAEDITADTFRDAVHALERSPQQQLTSGWLCTVASRRLADHWRAEYRHENAVARLSLERPTDDLPLIHGEVGQALDAMPVRQRTALYLRYVIGMSVGEVAEHLECSVVSATSLLARARRRLVAEYHLFAPEFANAS